MQLTYNELNTFSILIDILGLNISKEHIKHCPCTILYKIIRANNEIVNSLLNRLSNIKCKPDLISNCILDIQNYCEDHNIEFNTIDDLIKRIVVDNIDIPTILLSNLHQMFNIRKIFNLKFIQQLCNDFNRLHVKYGIIIYNDCIIVKYNNGKCTTFNINE